LCKRGFSPGCCLPGLFLGCTSLGTRNDKVGLELRDSRLLVLTLAVEGRLGLQLRERFLGALLVTTKRGELS
jgi:hypothetical protein